MFITLTISDLIEIGPIFSDNITLIVREHEALMNKLFSETQKTAKDRPNKEKDKK